MLFMNTKTTIYRTLILPVVLHGLRNLDSHIQGETQAEGVQELGVEEGILTKGGRSDRKLRKIT